MNLTKEEKNKRFRAWWQEIPQGQVHNIRERIMRKCANSQEVFYNWMKLRTEIPDLALREIELVAKEPIFSSKVPLYARCARQQAQQSAPNQEESKS